MCLRIAATKDRLNVQERRGRRMTHLALSPLTTFRGRIRESVFVSGIRSIHSQCSGHGVIAAWRIAASRHPETHHRWRANERSV